MNSTLLRFFLLGVSLATASLVDYENKGPISSSAEDDALMATCIPLIVLGMAGKWDARAKELIKLDSSNASHSSRTGTQAAMARKLLAERSTMPLSKDLSKELYDALQGSTVLEKEIRKALHSRHSQTFKTDKDLKNAMSKFASVDFADQYCISQRAYIEALFRIESKSLEIFKDADLMKKLKKDPKAYQQLVQIVSIQSSHVRESVLGHGDEKMLFGRHELIKQPERTAAQVLGDYASYLFVDTPRELAADAKKDLQHKVKRDVVEPVKEAAETMAGGVVKGAKALHKKAQTCRPNHP